MAHVCRFPDYAASIKMDRPKALRIHVAGSYAMSAGSDGRMVVEKLADTEGLVRIDGRDLDAFQFVYARGADRRLFPVVDGPAAEHWDRLITRDRPQASRDAFTPKETGGLPAGAEVVGFVLQIFAEAFRAGCRSRSRIRRWVPQTGVQDLAVPQHAGLRGCTVQAGQRRGCIREHARKRREAVLSVGGGWCHGQVFLYDARGAVMPCIPLLGPESKGIL